MGSIDNTSRNRFFLFVIFLLVLIMALRLPFDTDFWWHIRAGQDTVLSGEPVLMDLYSFTRFGSTWVNHSWLSQVIFYLIFAWFSLPGVMIFVALAAALSIFLIYKTMGAPILLNGFILVLTVTISAVIWTPRPQLFTYLFLALEQYLLYQHHKKPQKSTFIIFILMFFVWSNLHAGFSLGILFLGMWMAGEMIDRVFDHETPFKMQITDLYWFGLLILCSLVVMINPNGLDVWRVQFDTVSVSVLQDLIPEWASPNFHELYQQPFLWTWLLVVLFGLAVPARVEMKKILPLLLFGYLGFVARRNYGPFAIVAAPVLSELIYVFYQTRMKDSLFLSKLINRAVSQDKSIHPAINKIFNLFFFSILVLVLLGKFVYLSNPMIINYYEEQLYPQKAISWLGDNQLTGNGLNEYAWGGYMLWHLQHTPVFVDGRTDLFGDEIIIDWLTMVSGAEDWQEKLEDYDISWLLLEKDRPLLELLQTENWVQVYEDDSSMILKAPK